MEEQLSWVYELVKMQFPIKSTLNCTNLTYVDCLDSALLTLFRYVKFQGFNNKYFWYFFSLQR